MGRHRHTRFRTQPVNSPHYYNGCWFRSPRQGQRPLLRPHRGAEAGDPRGVRPVRHGRLRHHRRRGVPADDDPKMGERDSREEIMKAFRLFDYDETGKISFKNLKRVAKELGENMTDEELQEMIDEADRDGDGEVNEEEFFRIMKKTSLF